MRILRRGSLAGTRRATLGAVTASPVPAAAPAPARRRRLAVRWTRPGREVVRITLLALVVRLLAWVARPAILADSADIVGVAESVRTLGSDAALGSTHHPLALWLLGQCPGWADLETWGSVGAAVLSSLAVGPLHVIARSACGRHAATMACLLYAVLPKAVSVGSVPLAEPLFLPLALLALALGMTAGVARSPISRLGRPLLAGTAAALAYLARPEGLALAGIVVLATALRSRRSDRLSASALTLLAFVAVAGPWVAEISRTAGTLVLSPKKDLAQFAGADTTAFELAGDAAAGAAVRALSAAVWSALGAAVLLVPLGALPGRRWRLRPSRRSRWALIAGAVVLLGLLLRVASGWGYAGGRHALTASCLLLPFAGEGLLVLVAWVSRAVRRRRAALFLVILITVPTAVTAVLRPDGESGGRERLLGEAIAAAERERDGAGDVVIASFQESLVAYYADRALRGTGRRARNQRLRRDHKELILRSAELEGRRAELVAALRRAGASWIVLRLWDDVSENGATRHPGEDLADRLTDDGALGRPALAASELAAFPVK